MPSVQTNTTSSDSSARRPTTSCREESVAAETALHEITHRMMRPGRCDQAERPAADELRPVRFTRRFTRHAEGSVSQSNSATRRYFARRALKTRCRGSARQVSGVGDGGVRHAPALHSHAHGARGARGQAERRTQEIQRLIGARSGQSSTSRRSASEPSHSALRCAAG